ncbi:MAG: hypothetical protein RIQ93_2220 [Verrucomicrobiota bacterium]|jgi:DNA-binding beta-propeller fold protein YncE
MKTCATGGLFFSRFARLRCSSAALALLALAFMPLATGAGTNPQIGAGLKHLLYVTDDVAADLKIYDIDRGHTLVRTLALPELVRDLETWRQRRPGKSGRAAHATERVEATIRGITVDANLGWLWFTEDKTNTIYAYDFVREKMVWTINVGRFDQGQFPDRLNVTRDGKALYVPLKTSDRMLVLDSRTGEQLAMHPMHTNPHNTFIGEQGKYVYSGGRSGGPLYVFDQHTHQLVKKIGPFSGPIRPLTVDPTEQFFFANITKLEGIAAAEVATGRTWEVLHRVPPEREKYPQAKTNPMPHGNQPVHHGIAVRPGNKKEVWTIDDGWGYLYIYDYTTMPPKWIEDVPLFTDITQVAGPPHDRWVQFSNDGRYCYTPSRVIDATTRKVISTAMAVSEKIVEIDFQDGAPIAVSGQNGGVYPVGLK